MPPDACQDNMAEACDHEKVMRAAPGPGPMKMFKKMKRVLEGALAPFAFVVYGGTGESAPEGVVPRLFAAMIVVLLAGVAIVAAHQSGRGN